MKKLLNIQNFYVLLWVLYYTQGTYIAQGSIISRVVLLLFLSISIYYAFLTYAKYQINRYFKAFGLLLIMFTIYGLYGIMTGVSFDYLKLIYLSLLPTFPFYIWTIREQLSVRWVQIVFIVLVGVIMVQYFDSVRFIEERYTDTENAVVNVAYEVLALIPLLFFWKKRPLVQYLILAIIMIVVLSTVKRGAIIIGAISIFYFFYATTRESSKKMRWYVWLLIIAFIVFGVRYAVSFFENSAFAQMRMENTIAGDSSGRDVIYSKAWEIFINSNVIQFLFGHGAWATLRSIGVLAHNDWLEILVNQGIFGALVYLYYWIAFYKTIRQDKNKSTQSMLGMVMIIYFIATLFSMSYAAMTLPANLALGYGLAMRNTNSNAD